MLATLLFTDIMDSTRQATDLGNRRWHRTLEQHNSGGARQPGPLPRPGDQTTGDGFLATSTAGPCHPRGHAVRAELADHGLQIRAGLHTGEVELLGDDIGGIAVHIASRLAALSGPGEVLVSSTVKDLVARSGITFEDR